MQTRTTSFKKPVGAPVSSQLDSLFRLASGRLAVASERIWSHPDLAAVYPSYLERLYPIAQCTLVIMETARQRSIQFAPQCAVSSRLAEYFERHLVEEKDHDEWLLLDLERLGRDRDGVCTKLPPAEVVALIGTLYYWVNHHHPVSILAYLYVAEGYPFDTPFLDGVAKRTGIPPDAMRWFYRHASIDVHHGADLRRTIDDLALSTSHVKLLRATLISVVGAMSTFLERIGKIADRISTKD